MCYLAFPRDFELLDFRMMAEMFYQTRNRIIIFSLKRLKFYHWMSISRFLARVVEKVHWRSCSCCFQIKNGVLLMRATWQQNLIALTLRSEVNGKIKCQWPANFCLKVRRGHIHLPVLDPRSPLHSWSFTVSLSAGKNIVLESLDKQ